MGFWSIILKQYFIYLLTCCMTVISCMLSSSLGRLQTVNTATISISTTDMRSSLRRRPFRRRLTRVMCDTLHVCV